MKTLSLTAAVAFAAIAPATAALAQSNGVERMYILECGQGHTGDMSRWTPGKNVGVPMDIVDSCYLIKHSLFVTLPWKRLPFSRSLVYL